MDFPWYNIYFGVGNLHSKANGRPRWAQRVLDRACAGWRVREVLPCGWVKIVLCGIIWDFQMIWGYHMIWDRQMIWGYQMIWDCSMIWGYQNIWYRNVLDYMMCLLCYAFKSGQVIWAQKEPRISWSCCVILPSTLLIILTYPHLIPSP